MDKTCYLCFLSARPGSTFHSCAFPTMMDSILSGTVTYHNPPSPLSCFWSWYFIAMARRQPIILFTPKIQSLFERKCFPLFFTFFNSFFLSSLLQWSVSYSALKNGISIASLPSDGWRYESLTLFTSSECSFCPLSFPCESSSTLFFSVSFNSIFRYWTTLPENRVCFLFATLLSCFCFTLDKCLLQTLLKLSGRYTVMPWSDFLTILFFYYL